MSDYLWDRSGPVDPVIVDLESRLAPLAFDTAARPLVVSAPHSVREQRSPSNARRMLRWTAAAVAACALVTTGVVLWHTRRLDWQPSRPWTVQGGGQWPVGATLPVAGNDVRVDVARLGVLSARPGAALTLEATGPQKHWLRLTRGSIDVRLWAPPGRVALHTPAGDVIDLGCTFALDVDDAGAAQLSVRTGWVNLQNDHGNSFVPAGASSRMTAERAPLVPLYDDATPDFRAAVRVLEGAPSTAIEADLHVVSGAARPRDALTLLMLSRVDGLPVDARARLLARAAVLQPPPSPDTVARVLAGDTEAFWAWYDALPLPSLKNWWRNWRDAFPR